MKSFSRGFTLVETVIVIGLFVAVLFVLFQFFVNYNATYRYEQALIETAWSGGQSINEIENFALPALGVVATHNFTSGQRSSSATVLVLELPAIDASGNVLVGIYDHVVFYLDGSTLYRELETGVGSARHAGIKQLSERVGSLVFTYDNVTYDDVTKIDVDIETQMQIPNQIVTSSLSRQIYLRNVI